MSVTNLQKSRCKVAIYLKNNWQLYACLIPGLVIAVMFKFLPMTKIVIAFKNFKWLKGIDGSAWVVVYSIFFTIFSSTGIVNMVIKAIIAMFF